MNDDQRKVLELYKRAEAQQKEIIALLLEKKAWLETEQVRLKAEQEELKYQNALLQSTEQPAKKATRRAHSFQVIPGGKTEQASPGTLAEHS